MNIKSHVISFFGKSCAACVGLCALFYIVMEILSETSLDVMHGIPFGQFMLLLLSAVLLTAASYLFRLSLPKAINVLLNYIVCFLTLFLTFVLAGNLIVLNAGSVLVFLVIFSLCYLAYMGLFLLIRYLLYPERRREKTKREKKAEEEYTKRF